MASSRIFVKGLPPSMTPQDFKKHFGTKGSVTDARLFPQRRIGYIGFQDAEEAARAVKYFNKSFIRMSKIAVELARPIEESQPHYNRHANTARLENVTRHGSAQGETNSEQTRSLKRKRTEIQDPSQDPKLQEYLEVMRPSTSKKPTSRHIAETGIAVDPQAAAESEGEDAADYQTLPKPATVPSPTPKKGTKKTVPEVVLGDQQVEEGNVEKASERPTAEAPADSNTSDDAWLRSRTSRLLGLDEDEDEDGPSAPAANATDDESAAEVAEDSPVLKNATAASMQDPTGQSYEESDVEAAISDPQNDIEQKIMDSRRLYLRNLSYQVSEDAVRSHFRDFGGIEEVHISMDNKTGVPKGFAYLQFGDSQTAVEAWRRKDGQIFLGRLLHILPGAAKRTTELDEFALSKLPLKQQQRIRRKREASTSTFNWNALYMNADTIMSSVADRMGVAKSELLDPTSSDAAVKQAHAETHVIQETKSYFNDHGVDLDAFKRSERGDTTILVKNVPYDVGPAQIRRLFEEHGTVKVFLMPPTRTLAIVEYEIAAHARTAFGALAYRKLGNSVMFLEKAPKGILPTSLEIPASKQSATAADLLPEEAGAASGLTSTLHVKNLNFSTTSDRLSDVFSPLAGFVSAKVKTKTDAKKPGQVLSMGYGFIEFRSKDQADAALSAMDGYSLDSHTLQLRASHKGADAAEERRKGDLAKKLAGRRSKIIIKNLPFEASKKDVRALFGPYGQLRSVRVPKKIDKGARGFAFADFTTPKEAESAMNALKDTHLLGRRLVLDFAAEEAIDPEAEIEAMQKKVGSQLNKVALQRLTSNGRKKFAVGDQEAEE